jgi:hypothetical protein
MAKEEKKKKKISFFLLSMIVFSSVLIAISSVGLGFQISPFELGLTENTFIYGYMKDMYNENYPRLYATLGSINVLILFLWGLKNTIVKIFSNSVRVNSKIKQIAIQLSQTNTLKVKYISENEFMLFGDFRNEEFFKRYEKNGQIYKIEDTIKKELRDLEQKDNSIKLKIINSFVNPKDIKINISFMEIEEKQRMNGFFSEIIERIERELKLDYYEEVEENTFKFVGDNKDTESIFYKNFGGDKIFKFEDNLPKTLKEYGKKDKVIIHIQDIKKGDNFEVILHLEKRKILLNVSKEMVELTDILEIKDRYGDNPQLLDFSLDKNNQQHLFYEKLPTIENSTWTKEMKIVKNLFNLNPIISFNKDNVEIALYEDIKPISSFGNEEFKKHLKQGKIHLGINQKQEQVYLDLNGLKHFLFGATTGGGKGVLMQLMTHSAVYQLNTKTISSIDIIDPKATEMGHYKGLDKNINVFLGYEEIPKAIFNMEVEFEARRKYLSDNKLRKIFENYKVIFFDEFDQINKLADEQGREVSDYCFTKLKRVLQLGRSFGVKVFLTSQDLTAETIPTTFRALFEDKMVGKTLESYHASVLVDSYVFESMGYENTKSLTTGQFIIQAGMEAIKENSFVQSYFSEANPNIQGEELCRFKEVYEKGKEELEQTEEFEKILDIYRIAILKEMSIDKNLEDFKKDLVEEALKSFGIEEKEEIKINNKEKIEEKKEEEIEEEEIQEDFMNLFDNLNARRKERLEKIEE